MKVFFRAILVLASLPVLTFAQSNYRAGYVVTLKGDTVKGFIDYREWDLTPEAVNFKHSLTDNNAVKYTPADIDYFSIGMIEAYRRYSGPISNSSVDPNNLRYETNEDTSSRIATVFLKVMEKGDRVALYSYKDDLKIRYYIAEAPDYKPTELIFRVTRTGTQNIYQKQLDAIALRHSELDDKMETFIARSEYDGENLVGIVTRLNHMTKAEFKKNNYTGSVFNLFIGAGMQITTTTTDAGSSYAAAGGTSYTSYLPMASVGINAYANPATRKLQFRLEVSLAESKYQSLYTSKVTPQVPTEVTYNAQALAVSPQIIYNFYNTDAFKVFAGVGMVFSHFSESNAYFGPQDHSNAAALQVAANNPFYFTTGDNAFTIKAGVQFTKHLAIFADYQSTIFSTQTPYFSLTSTCSQIGLNYYF